MTPTRLQATSTATAGTAKGKFTAKAESQALLAANEARIALYLANPSGKEVWVALGETAVKEEGIWLKKESVLPHPILGYTGVVSCITTAEEGSITYVEL